MSKMIGSNIISFIWFYKTARQNYEITKSIYLILPNSTFQSFNTFQYSQTVHNSIALVKSSHGKAELMSNMIGSNSITAQTNLRKLQISWLETTHGLLWGSYNQESHEKRSPGPLRQWKINKTTVLHPPKLQATLLLTSLSFVSSTNSMCTSTYALFHPTSF